MWPCKSQQMINFMSLRYSCYPDPWWHNGIPWRQVDGCFRYHSIGPSKWSILWRRNIMKFIIWLWVSMGQHLQEDPGDHGTWSLDVISRVATIHFWCSPIFTSSHILIEIDFSAGCLRFGMQKNNMVFLKESRDHWWPVIEGTVPGWGICYIRPT